MTDNALPRNTLASLESINVRDVWPTEDKHFTPWLAQEVGLETLGKALYIDLEDPETEEGVGGFKCDIRCQIGGTDDVVIIENQFGQTDHDHLGKLLVYSAGLEASIIIWVAETFREEHRATLDWLNDHSPDPISFFGVEIKCFKIGNSRPAPKFEIVAKPNDWKKGGTTRSRIGPRHNFRLDYWTALKHELDERNGTIRSVKPNTDNWTGYGIGRSGLAVGKGFHPKERILRGFGYE